MGRCKRLFRESSPKTVKYGSLAYQGDGFKQVNPSVGCGQFADIGIPELVMECIWG